ncbi:MAG: hypothetical protein D6694_07050 [Gammaproteobacteria bacterium]|nr:MAG: hypothetical protein D6694_07050 [Gammaproteobacteria bacterium]
MEKTGETSVEVMKLMTYLMLSLLREKQEEQEEGLTEENKRDIDTLCAEAFKKCVIDRGDEIMPGSLYYKAEGYTIFADLCDPAGMPVYSVISAESGDVVFSFQEYPEKEGEFVFFETANELTDEQKAEVLDAFLGQMEKDPSSRSGVQKTVDDLDRMGVLAPDGCKAAIVADQVMGANSSVRGQKYNFNRADNGTIEISSVFGDKLYAMTPDGSVHSFSDSFRHKKDFDQMFNTLQQTTGGRSRQQEDKSKTVKQQVDRGGR